MKKLSLFTFLFFAFSLQAYAQWEHQDENYSILFPDNWKKVSSFAFQPSGESNSLGIYIRTGSRYGKSYEQIRNTFTSDNAEERFNSANSGMTNVKIQNVSSDSEKKSISIYLTTDIKGVSLKMRYELMVGNENMISIICMTPVDNFEQYSEDFSSIIDSFKFHPGLEYNAE
jgi:hypothetical protein